MSLKPSENGIEGDDEREEESEEENSDEEAEEEEKPRLKYQRMGGSVPTLLQSDGSDATSCIAVSERMIALGTRSGSVHILDYLRNQVKQFIAHTAAVNDLCFDIEGEYIGSCSDDGSVVVINSLFTEEILKFEYNRPMKAIALNPDYVRKASRRFVTGGLAGHLYYNVKKWIGYRDLVELYADYDPKMLLPFLRSSQHYTLEKAIEFVSNQHDDNLWEELIKQCMNKPEMVGVLLEHTVGNLDPLYIVNRVPNSLEIPRTETSLRHGCNDILIKADCVNLLIKCYKEARRAIYLGDEEDESHNKSDKKDRASRPAKRSLSVRTMEVKSKSRCGARCCICFDPFSIQDVAIYAFFCCHAYHETCLSDSIISISRQTKPATPPSQGGLPYYSENGDDDDEMMTVSTMPGYVASCVRLLLVERLIFGT